jgi:hypothetical protein
VQGKGHEDVFEVPTAENEDPVEALAPHGPDPAFGVRALVMTPVAYLFALTPQTIVSGTGGSLPQV